MKRIIIINIITIIALILLLWSCKKEQTKTPFERRKFKDLDLVQWKEAPKKGISFVPNSVMPMTIDFVIDEPAKYNTVKYHVTDKRGMWYTCQEDQLKAW